MGMRLTLHTPHVLRACLLAVSVLFVGGCAPKRPIPTAPAYDGPTETMAQVVAAFNQNNQRLATLWAYHDFRATIVDDKDKTHFVSGNGALLYKAPRGFKLVGTRPVVGNIFEIGSTEEHYWLKLLPEVDTMWWGTYRNLGRPCAREIPLRPDLVLEVLGVATVNSNFKELPAPTMRFDNEADAYVLVWNSPLPDRWVAIKEIWYDRKTRLPQRVLLYDEHGRVVLRAALSGHEPVELPEAPPEQWPRVATRYELRFPDSGTEMSFQLSELAPDRNGIPTRRGIAFDPQRANVSHVVQIDEDCDP